jgi:hypothetical protein
MSASSQALHPVAKGGSEDVASPPRLAKSEIARIGAETFKGRDMLTRALALFALMFLLGPASVGAETSPVVLVTPIV